MKSATVFPSELFRGKWFSGRWFSGRWFSGKVLLLAAVLGTTVLASAGEAVFSPVSLAATELAPANVSTLPLDWETQSEQYESQLQTLHAESETLQALTIARGRSYVRRARAGLLPVSAGFDAFAQHLAQLERLRRAITRDLKRQDEIVQERLATAQLLNRLQSLRPSEKTAMAKARNAVLASHERDAAFARAFQTPAGSATTDPADRRHGALHKTAKGRIERPDTVYGALAISSDTARTDFENRRGQLPFPIAGRTEMIAVRSTSGSGRALSIACAAAAPVRAVHRGRIAFADDYPGQGKTVIIDHGNQHFSLNANLQSIDVRVGDELSAGDAIGRAGFHDGKSRLLFEIRQGSQALNTPSWFGL